MASTKQSKLLEEVHAQILNCAYCRSRSRGSLVPGEGSVISEIVFVGEAPGKQEAETGRPFIGRAGKVLRTQLESIGIDPDEVFITSAVKYLPQGYVTPKPDDIAHGRTHLFRQLEIIQPKVIVLLGNTAALSVLGQKFSISASHGMFIEKAGLTYFISYHPAAPLYSPKLLPELSKDFKKLKKKL